MEEELQIRLLDLVSDKFMALDDADAKKQGTVLDVDSHPHHQ